MLSLPASGSATVQGDRELNEDFMLVDPSLGLYIVADGVGGEQAGQVASRLACETIRTSLQSGFDLQDATRRAHQAVMLLAQRRGWRRMASTVAALRFQQNHYEIAWVGDSRVYLWDGELKLLTKDHSYVQNLVDARKLEFSQGEAHPEGHLITRALGMPENRLRIGCNRGALGDGCRLLICSDGISGQLPPERLLELLADDQEPQALADRLTREALDAGGSDNATCIVLEGSGEAEVHGDVEPMIYQRFDGVAWSDGVANVTNALDDTQRLTAPALRSDDLLGTLCDSWPLWLLGGLLVFGVIVLVVQGGW